MRDSLTDRRGWSANRRSRYGRRAVLLFIVLSTFGGLFTSVAPRTASADELSDAYARQQRLQRYISRQRSSITALTASQEDLSRQISGTKATLSEVNANLLVVKTQLVSMTVEVAQSQNAVDELVATAGRLDAELLQIEAEEVSKQAELEESKAILAARINDAYDTDRTSMIETFLSGDDFTDVLTEVGYVLDFAEQDKILAEKIVSDQEVLKVLHENVLLARDQTEELHALAAESKGALDRQKVALDEQRAELARLEAETKRLLAEQQRTYEKMARHKKTLAGQLAAARAAQAKLEALISKLVRESLERGGIPSRYNGTLSWPMSGQITQEFGCTGFSWEPPHGNCAHFHQGIDIAAPMYTPIRAAGAGRVVWAGPSPYDPSWIVIIAHSSQLVTWYAHVDNNRKPPKVREGEYVNKGDIVAYEGMTGWTTGPHLHWQVQLDDTFVNPRLFLPR
jgi:murein DD-endopeptidase MepM/ murein hydrolase activator NlpD